MRMSVCEIGYPRTATRSLARAMRLLGYTAKHGTRKLPVDEQRRVTDQILYGQHNLDIYDQYDFVGSLPVMHWWQLWHENPDMKFILTTRPTDQWWTSCDERWRGLRRVRCNGFLDEGVRSDLVLSVGMTFRLFGCYAPNKQLWMQAKEAHEHAVIDQMGWFNRMLVFDVFSGDGWEKLCKFLDKPVPDAPYPNSRKAI